jgi:hypothetical protein
MHRAFVYPDILGDASIWCLTFNKEIDGVFSLRPTKEANWAPSPHFLVR